MQSSDNGPGLVMESKMADNPFSRAAPTAARNDVIAADAGSAAGRLDAMPAGNRGAWAYDQREGAGGVIGMPISDFKSGHTDVGQFWAHTDTPGVSEFRF